MFNRKLKVSHNQRHNQRLLHDSQVTNAYQGQPRPQGTTKKPITLLMSATPAREMFTGCCSLASIKRCSSRSPMAWQSITNGRSEKLGQNRGKHSWNLNGLNIKYSCSRWLRIAMTII